ncbi:MAG TPA: ABC transporter permease [Ktedonobacterales bacterium]
MMTLSYAMRDTATMLWRDAQHSLRYLPMTVSGILTPVIMLVLFDYFFGGALGSGVGGAAHGSYINYLAPGILVMTVASGCESTAVNLVTDLNENIITRFRTMAIAQSAVLAGTAVGSLIRSLLSITLVLAVALLMGFRPVTDPGAWVMALGVVALFVFGVTWMGIVFGLVGKTPAGANSLSLLFLLLAFTSSAFVSTETMPAAVRWYADYQPFTPVINTLRGLLLGTPVSAGTLALAVAWSAGLALLGYLLSRLAYRRLAAR